MEVTDLPFGSNQIKCPASGKIILYVTLSVKEASLKNVFDQIQQQTGLNFFFKTAWLAQAKKPPRGTWVNMPFKQCLFYASVSNLNVLLWKANNMELDPDHPEGIL